MKRTTCEGCPYFEADYNESALGPVTFCRLGHLYLEGYGSRPASLDKPSFCNRSWRRAQRRKRGIDPTQERWKLEACITEDVL